MTDPFKRIAIITGATSGIGEATARAFLEDGFGVIGNGRNKSRLKELEKEFGKAFRGVAGDAGEEAVIDSLFEKAEKHFGRPADTVVANAGRGLGGTVTTVDMEQFRDVLNINVTGTLYLLKKASEKLVALQDGSYPDTSADIVILGSTVGRHISPFSTAYGSTKFAVHALAEGLRREIGPKGVRVTLVEPGIVISKFQETAGYTEDLVKDFHMKFGPLIYGYDIADAIHYVVSRPPHVHIGDFVIRATRQDFP